MLGAGGHFWALRFRLPVHLWTRPTAAGSGRLRQRPHPSAAPWQQPSGAGRPALPCLREPQVHAVYLAGVGGAASQGAASGDINPRSSWAPPPPQAGPWQGEAKGAGTAPVPWTSYRGPHGHHPVSPYSCPQWDEGEGSARAPALGRVGQSPGWGRKLALHGPTAQHPREVVAFWPQGAWLVGGT